MTIDWLLGNGSSWGDPGWVIVGGSRVGHHGRIQDWSSCEDPEWVIMGGSRMGHHGRIQDGS